MTDSNFASQSQSGKPGNLPTLHVVPFHGDSLATFEHDGERWVAMRPIVENLGIDWARQAKRLTEGGRFNCGHMSTVGADGKQREMLSIPLRRFPGWLATINPNKIPDPTKRAKVILYQERSFDALYDFWVKGVAFRDDMEGVVTDLDPRVMSMLGGMFKRILQKHDAETEARVRIEVERQMAEQRGGYTPGWTAGEVVKQVANDTKGLKGLPRVVSYALWRFHAQKGALVRLGTLGATSAYVFDPAICREWLAAGGKGLILRYIEKKRGSVNLFRLVPTEKESV